MRLEHNSTGTVTPPKSPSAEGEVVGLCATCDHAKTCLFLQAAHHPVWHCDEFDDGTTSTAKGHGRELSTPSPESYSATTLAEKGLCVTCETRNGCRLRRPGLATQDCNEYR